MVSSERLDPVVAELGHMFIPRDSLGSCIISEYEDPLSYKAANEKPYRMEQLKS